MKFETPVAEIIKFEKEIFLNDSNGGGDYDTPDYEV
jgi:hypothetical protein